MFTGELAESRQTEVVIRDIDERAMELLIDFAYTSQVTIITVSSVLLIFSFINVAAGSNMNAHKIPCLTNN